jgi:type II secretory pathway component PulM
MSIAKNKGQKEAAETTLQEFQDKFSDMTSMNPDVLISGMVRAQSASKDKDRTSAVRKSLAAFTIMNRTMQNAGSSEKLHVPSSSKTLRASSAPIKKKK